MRVAVIGAGMAGLSCARALEAQGVAVTVFDKGRDPGGRVATRVAGAFTFDHGTPWLSAPHGLPAEPWLGSFWVGVPAMAALPLSLAVPDMRQGRHVAYLHAQPAGWFIRHRTARDTQPGLISAEGGELDGPYDRVVLAIPAPQAAPLLAACACEALADDVRHAKMTPVWTLMAGWAEPGGQDPRDLRETLSMVVRDSSRPGRAIVPECWTAHADQAWSASHILDDPAAVQAELLSALMAGISRSAPPDFVAVHRWRYARTATALGQPCIDAGGGLVVCGDWCLGANVEHAIASGQAAAAACR